MRITGGKARGIPLSAGKQSAARPATDRLREAVFSSLGEAVAGARFFDLFAGSGAYGLEAWSRGAAGGIFVERNRGMVGALRRNIVEVGRSLGETEKPEPRVTVAAADATRWTPPAGERAGLIFVDPPYDLIPAVAPSLFHRFTDWIDPDGIVLFEMPGEIELSPPGWECVKRLGKGRHQPSCCFFRLLQSERPYDATPSH